VFQGVLRRVLRSEAGRPTEVGLGFGLADLGVGAQAVSVVRRDVIVTFLIGRVTDKCGCIGLGSSTRVVRTWS
jgi:hypothetical protein